MANGQRLIKHGTAAGYNAEIEVGNVCDRCRAARRVYQAQFSKRAKAARNGAPPQYGTHDVIDHLYTGRRSVSATHSRTTAPQYNETQTRAQTTHDRPSHQAASSETDTHAQSDGQDGPTLADRVSDGLRRFVMPPGQSDGYIANEDAPDYLHQIDADSEPDEDWSQPDEEFVINKAGMQLIEENLGTYLSVIGITMEMIDPYCGPILADNFENIVGRWTKVIAKYPRAAKLFMSKDGGTLMTWIGALQATWPVLLAIYDHHLAKTIDIDSNGQPYKVRKVAGQNGHVDATMPPMPGYEYTVD